MSHLVDINVMVACSVRGHAHHVIANSWLRGAPAFSTAPSIIVGCMRVFMSPAYRYSFADARGALDGLIADRRHSWIVDDVQLGMLPEVRGHKEVHDAHLVVLARNHGLKLATLDEGLCAKPWAQDVAELVGTNTLQS